MLAACSPDEYTGGLGKQGTSRLSLQGSQKTLDYGKAGLWGWPSVQNCSVSRMLLLLVKVFSALCEEKLQFLERYGCHNGTC